MNSLNEKWNIGGDRCEMSQRKDDVNDMMESVEERICKWKCTMSDGISQTESAQRK